MPAEPPLNGAHPAKASADSAADNAHPNRTLGGLATASHAETSESPGLPSLAERLGAERAERRHQRMLVREAAAGARDSAVRDSDRAAPRKRTTTSAGRLTPPGRQSVRGSVPVTLIVTVVAGGVLGAMLGALSVAGSVIGLLVAVLTLVLSAVSRRYSRST
jgi:Flp pilus assembly protein TadB